MRTRTLSGLGLLTDLYQLTMGAAYLKRGIADSRAVFELFVRHLPPVRSYMVFAGLEPVLQYFDRLAFTPAEVQYLRRHEMFQHVGPEFFERLRHLRFSGDVWAMPEGTVAFAGEPLLRVEAPLFEAQLVETFLLSMINFQTSVATKAARIVQAAAGRGVVEFGTRRAHTPYAGLYGARAAYVGGCIGTSNLEAGYEYGIPVLGTFSHSYTLAFEDEAAAFRNFWDVFRQRTTLLIDTYDTLRGAGRAAGIGLPVHAVRLDSGDFLQLSRRVRALLDRRGRPEIQIMASGDLNEYRIEDLTRLGAPIDSYGVGTELITSQDAPALGGIYKLVEIERRGRAAWPAKFSPRKATVPGRKQVYRFFRPPRPAAGRAAAARPVAESTAAGQMLYDWVELQDAPPPRGGHPLLVPVLRGGRRAPAGERAADLRAARERCLRQLEQLPARYRRLVEAARYPVRLSPALQRLLRQARQQLK